MSSQNAVLLMQWELPLKQFSVLWQVYLSVDKFCQRDAVMKMDRAVVEIKNESHEY